MRTLKAGTRGSKLALYQTHHVSSMIPNDVEIITIQTRGDKIQDVALAKLEGKAFFTKEIDDALLRGDVDFAVHSFKDVPTDLPDGMIIAAVPERETPSDAIVSVHPTFDSLPAGAVIGTSSLRRQSYVRAERPDLVVKDLRGNVDTRVRKLSEGQYDAIIGAEAGLKRMGFFSYYALDPKKYNPAAGQGAIAVTTRSDDPEVIEIFRQIDDPDARLTCTLERIFLEAIGGGCQIPAGVHTTIDRETDEFVIYGFIATPDGKQFIRDTLSGTIDQGKDLSIELAKRLLDSGGGEILNSIREGARTW
jgi:hydroxymethylbilane synthase